MKNEEKFIKYLIKCCEDVLGKQVKRVGYPRAKKEYGLILPVIQLAKINYKLKTRLKELKVDKQ